MTIFVLLVIYRTHPFNLDLGIHLGFVHQMNKKKRKL
jgi:hypothetical protein